MYVLKRNGERQEVQFDAILERISKLSEGLNVDPADVTKQVAESLCDGIKTTQLDELAAEVCASLAVKHSDYSQLAARIAISNIHKETNPSFSETIKRLHSYIEPKTGKHSPYISDELLEVSIKYGSKIDKQIDHDRDFITLDYFGLSTLRRAYLMKFGNQIIERPQHLFMRVALGIHGDDLEAAFETYNLMSQKDFIHATPTLFNCGTPIQQMSSCFLLSIADDSVPGIYETLADCALISQSSGGIGLHVHNIRAKGSFIAGSRGISSGLTPMLKNYEQTLKYINQGGKRNGSATVYLEPWHSDIREFISLRKNTGAEEMRARDLFLALWIPDLFMKRVEEDGDWTLMCPHECPELFDTHSKEFEELYTRYEREGRGREKIKARDLWVEIIDAQAETGGPFVMYKDSANRKSNQNNLGTIRGSNLCTEIIQYTSSDESAVCNLASICLNSFVNDGAYDYKRLHEVSKVVCRNINKIIDKNYYPTGKTKNSNFKHRPMGIGVQGLADTFALMKLDFDSKKARELNKNIFETIYHGAIEASIELAKKDGVYDSYEGSPASKGQFQFDLWGVTPDSGLYDWEKTREDMKKYGLRNSLLLAPMPTASTASILGNNEAFEAFTNNMYVRRTLSGDFVVANKHLLRDLEELNLWDQEMRNELMANKGSVQNIERVPEHLRDRYRTVWEIPQRSIIDMAADRAPYICQGMSMNIHIRGATRAKLTALHFHSWKSGLKTGMYYLRNTPSVDAVAFTVDNTRKPEVIKTEVIEESKVGEQVVVSDDDPNVCLSCGS